MEDFRILDPDPYNNSTGSASLLTGVEASLAEQVASADEEQELSLCPLTRVATLTEAEGGC